MDTAFGGAVAVLCILGGAASFLAPHTIAPFQEDADTTPEQLRMTSPGRPIALHPFSPGEENIVA